MESDPEVASNKAIEDVCQEGLSEQVGPKYNSCVAQDNLTAGPPVYYIVKPTLTQIMLLPG